MKYSYHNKNPKIKNIYKIVKVISKKTIYFILVIICLLALVIWPRSEIYYKTKIELVKRFQEPFLENNVINNDYFGIDSTGREAEKTTKGINEAIKYAKKNNIDLIRLEKGKYLIDGKSENDEFNETDTKKGIILESNMTLDLNGSEIIQEKNSSKNYANISVTDIENVKIMNGIIIGDKDEHDYNTLNSTHEWGFGIDVRGSKNVKLTNLEISNCTGDGIIITDYKERENYPENIKVSNVDIHDCRRQGISLIAGRNIEISENEIYNINGTAPQSGIDLESWDSNQIIDNVYIKNNKIYNTKSNRAIIVMGMSRNVYIQENEIQGIVSCDNIKEQLIIQNNLIQNGTVSLLVTDQDLKKGKIIKKAVVEDNKLENSNLYIYNAENVLIANNTLTNKVIMAFKSNACFINNNMINEQDNYLQYRII